MANFEIAQAITMKTEAGYANNPNDNGGETFAGIARKFWPNWNGWQYIDRHKAIHGLNFINSLLSDVTMQRCINEFYKANFWDINKLDLITDQQIANSVYDMGVNAGTGTVAKMLQRAANVVVDGNIGSGTLADVNSGNAEFIYNSINSQRESYYNQLATKPNQAQFLKSWLSRIKPYQK